MSRRNKCCHEENVVAVEKKPNFEPKYIEYLKSILCLPVGCRSKICSVSHHRCAAYYKLPSYISSWPIRSRVTAIAKVTKECFTLGLTFVLFLFHENSIFLES